MLNKGEMMKRKWGVCVAIVSICVTAQAEWAMIGHAGNSADSLTGYGAVDYTYKIGKYEVTAGEFKMAVAADDRIADDFSGSGDYPVVNVGWSEAAKYCNWLTTSNAYNGAYQFDKNGALTNTLSRADILSAGGMFYVLSTANEWYKAAYFKPDGSGYSLYANGTGDVPVKKNRVGWTYDKLYTRPSKVGRGAVEQNGTYDMMGNVWERVEDAKGLRFGGAYVSKASFLSAKGSRPLGLATQNEAAGFRLVMMNAAP